MLWPPLLAFCAPPTDDSGNCCFDQLLVQMVHELDSHCALVVLMLRLIHLHDLEWHSRSVGIWANFGRWQVVRPSAMEGKLAPEVELKQRVRWPLQLLLANSSLPGRRLTDEALCG